jgi:hypothetical protein
MENQTLLNVGSFLTYRQPSNRSSKASCIAKLCRKKTEKNPPAACYFKTLVGGDFERKLSNRFPIHIKQHSDDLVSYDAKLGEMQPTRQVARFGSITCRHTCQLKADNHDLTGTWSVGKCKIR